MRRKFVLAVLALLLCIAAVFAVTGCSGAQGPAGEQGADGKDGAGWLSGTEAPTQETGGNTGDFYLDEDDFDIYKLTESGWTLIGNIKGSDGAAGEKGEQGEQGAAGASGEKGEQGPAGQQGVGIADIEIEYYYGADGREYIRFTIYYTDEDVQVIETPAPSKAVHIELGKNSYAVCAPGEEPQMFMSVEYEDGSLEVVAVEDGMFIADASMGYEKIDFQTPGTYRICIGYGGAVIEDYVTVYDPQDDSIKSISVNAERIIVLVQDGAVVEDLTGLEVTAHLANGRQAAIPADEVDLYYEFSAENALMPVEVRYEPEAGQSFSDYFEAIPVSSLPAEEYLYHVVYVGDNMLMCEQGQEPFADGEYFLAIYNLNEYGYAAYPIAARTDMLNGFDSQQPGIQEYPVDIPELGERGTSAASVSVAVYGPQDLTVERIYLNSSEACIGSDYGNLALTVVYNTAEGGGFTKDIPFSPDMITEGSLDLNTAGDYTFTVAYGGAEIAEELTVYDPDVCNIRDMWVDQPSGSGFTATAGEDELAYIQEHIAGRTLQVNFYEPIGQIYSVSCKITPDMIDISAFDTDSLFGQYITITYGLTGQQPAGVRVNITVRADMSGAQPVKTYTFPEEYGGMLGENIVLYDNGFAVGSFGIGNDQTFAYTAEDGLLTVNMGNGLDACFTTDEAAGEAAPYAPTGDPAVYVNEDNEIMMAVYDGYIEISVYMGPDMSFPLYCFSAELDAQSSIELPAMGVRLTAIPPESGEGIGDIAVEFLY